MQVFWLVVVSLLPGLAWLYFFYRKDKYESEPPLLVLLAFFYGGLAVIPAGIIEFPFQEAIMDPPNLFVLLLLSIFVIGVTEEVVKFGVIRYTIYYSQEFNEIMDGIIYSAAAGLGFATVENLLYTMMFGYQVGLKRAVITSLLHASFSGVMGYYLGKAKFENDSRWIWKGLVQVILFHGIYDFLVLGELIPLEAVFLMVAVFYLYLAHLIRLALAQSPFRPF